MPISMFNYYICATWYGIWPSGFFGSSQLNVLVFTWTWTLVKSSHLFFVDTFVGLTRTYVDLRSHFSSLVTCDVGLTRACLDSWSRLFSHYTERYFVCLCFMMKCLIRGSFFPPWSAENLLCHSIHWASKQCREPVSTLWTNFLMTVGNSIDFLHPVLVEVLYFLVESLSSTTARNRDRQH